jgi:hypothetical protein
MLAEREGINESALVKQLLEMVLRMSALGDLTRYRRRTDQTAVQGSTCAWLLKTAGGSRSDRALEIGVSDHRLASGALHLRDAAPLPKAEYLALKQSVLKLTAMGRNLNQSSER